MIVENYGTTAGLSVAVVEHDSRTRARLAMQLGNGHMVTDHSSIGSFESGMVRGTPTVVVLGPSFAESAELADVERLARTRPEAGLVLVVDELSTSVLQQALRAGVRDVLATPDPSQLLEAVGRVGDSLNLVPRVGGPGEGGGVPGRLSTIFSTKGGAGKSMLACNLAVVLARRSERPVALVDADLQFGDVAVMLKLTPQHTIVDAVGAIDRLDPALMQSLMIRHEPSGVLVLPAPVEPAFADQVSASDMVRIIEVLRTFCDHVVVDTPAYFNDVVLSLLEESDDIVLVAGMDIPNIKNVKIGLQTLRLLNTPVSKLKLVLNRANSKVKLDVAEVERTLQIKADSLIPSDVAVPQSVNKGTPIVLDAPRSSVTKSIEQLAELLAMSEDKRRRR
jgi:pilus assembly protein CpaE